MLTKLKKLYQEWVLRDKAKVNHWVPVKLIEIKGDFDIAKKGYIGLCLNNDSVIIDAGRPERIKFITNDAHYRATMYWYMSAILEQLDKDHVLIYEIRNIRFTIKDSKLIIEDV